MLFFWWHHNQEMICVKFFLCFFTDINSCNSCWNNMFSRWLLLTILYLVLNSDWLRQTYFIHMIYNKLSPFTEAQVRPNCCQVYNLFHATDPCAGRVESLLESSFSQFETVRVPRYTNYPLGDGLSNSLCKSNLRFT